MAAGRRSPAAERPPVVRRWPLRTATAVVAVEAGLLVVATVGLTVYQLTGHRPLDALNSWLVVVLAALGAVGLFAVWRGLLHGNRRARSPGVLTQLIVIPIGVTSVQHGGWWAGVPLVVGGLAGLVGLLAPSSTEVFYG
jgi:O-antigen/teichoic acid export membrane protein